MEEVLALLKRAQEGDKEARDTLVVNNLGLIHHIVKRLAGRGYETQDLFQIGSIGLLKAIDHFNVDYEVCFSTYAVPMITGEIKRFLRDDGMVKVSRILKENGWKIKQASEKLSYLLGRDATLEEISQETGIAREDIVAAMEANTEVESIYKAVYQADGSESLLAERVVGNATGGIGKPIDRSSLGLGDYEKEKLLDHMLLEQLMERLGQTERQLILLRYFEDKTQTEVAGYLGISQVQVSRMEKKILFSMRQLLT